MPTEKQIVALLDMLTEGAAAPAATESVAAAAETLHKAAKPWTEGKGIQGIGVGEKITDGEQLQKVVLKVYVDQKRPKSQLDNPVPPKVRMPGLDEQVETDVEEIGRVLEGGQGVEALTQLQGAVARADRDRDVETRGAGSARAGLAQARQVVD